MIRFIRLEELVGRKVFGPDGQPVGRLEEIVVRRRGSTATIAEYHVGRYGALEMLTFGVLGRALLTAFPFTRPTIYRVPWDEMDLSDLERPRLLRRRLQDLERAA